MKNQADQKIAHLHKIIDTIREIDRLIISEKDPELIVENICKILVDTRGYCFVWIVLFGKNHDIKFFTGLGDSYIIKEVEKQLLHNKIPDQILQLISNTKDSVLKEIPPKYLIKPDRSKWLPFLAPLRDDHKKYGIICAGIPKKDYNHPKEEQTFVDIANNIGFALAKIEQTKKIEDSERRYKALHDSSFGGLVIHDEGLILDCNKELGVITGYTKDELVGMNGLLLIAEDQRTMVMNNILGEYEQSYETFGLRKNGQRYPLRIDGKMIPYGNKMVRVTELRDITEAKKIEKELILAKEKAEQSDKLKSSFLANMSHEIRTPMNGILGFTELLKEPDLSTHQREEFIDVIQTSGERMLNTINDIIDISKIESGMVSVNMQDINLSSLMNDTYMFFQPSMQKKGINFKVNENNGNPMSLFHTDPDKINSILTNLIKNAYKFTEEGTIEFGYTIDNNFIHFYVHDTGVGIPKDRQQAIFDRFVQADVADSRIFEGSGLGLAITKSYAEMLNGIVSLKSEIGQGASFTVSLPIPSATNNGSTNEHQDSALANNTLFHKLKILIAEDDSVSIELLKLLLNDVSSELLIAVNGKEAVLTAEKHPDIDLILMDIKMPVIDGFTAAAKIREFNKSVKIIVQSAFAQAEDMKKALEVGCDDFVSKPINKQLLIESINSLFPKDIT